MSEGRLRFRQVLFQREFAVTVEMTPPKGTNLKPILESGKQLIGRVHAINVTDNPAAVMRACPLAVCRHLVEQGHDPIMQVTSRDRNRLGLQSDLLGASTLGIQNVLCLTGDPPHVGDHKEARSVCDLDSVQMMKTVQSLNSGKDLAGKFLDGGTDFFIGGTVSPGVDTVDVMRQKFAAKVQAGALFFQTQVVFSAETFRTFMTDLPPNPPKILAGLMVLRSAKMAEYLHAKIPGIQVPKSILEELHAAGPEHEREAGIEIAIRTIKALRPYCDGVHIMGIKDIDSVLTILTKAELS